MIVKIQSDTLWRYIWMPLQTLVITKQSKRKGENSRFKRSFQATAVNWKTVILKHFQNHKFCNFCPINWNLMPRCIINIKRQQIEMKYWEQKAYLFPLLLGGVSKKQPVSLSTCCEETTDKGSVISNQRFAVAFITLRGQAHLHNSKRAIDLFLRQTVKVI